MKMKSARQAEQYERAYPILVARELLKRSKAKNTPFEYFTSWLHSSDEVHVPLNDQLRLLNDWNKRGLINAPELTEDEKGETHVKDGYIPEEGGRIFEVTVSDQLESLYLNFSFYVAQVGNDELRFKEQVAELKKILKERAAKFHRKDIEVKDGEVPTELNPFLAVLFLEMERKIAIDFLKPPARYTAEARVILKATLSKSLYVIRTSKFHYDLETGILTLNNGKSAEFGTDTKLGKLLCGMDESYVALYDKDIVRVAGSNSAKSHQEAASQLVHDIRKRLDLKEGDENDIFASGNGWRLAP